MTDAEFEAHFKKIYGKLEEVSKSQDIIISDLDKDRGDLSDFTIELARTSGVVGALHKNQKRIAEKIGEKIEDIIEPMQKQTKSLQKTIESKKAIAFKPKKPFWKFWG